MKERLGEGKRAAFSVAVVEGFNEFTGFSGEPRGVGEGVWGSHYLWGQLWP
jgi:hypothetical protein